MLHNNTSRRIGQVVVVRNDHRHDTMKGCALPTLFSLLGECLYPFSNLMFNFASTTVMVALPLQTNSTCDRLSLGVSHLLAS